MDRKFKRFLIISIFVHFIIIISFFYILSVKNLKLKFNEEKKVTVSTRKISKKFFLKKIPSKNDINDLKSNNLKEYKEKINKSVKIENEVKLNVKSDDYIYKYGNIQLREHKYEYVDIFEDFKISDRYEKEDILKKEDGYLNFTEGERRILINDNKEDFLSLNLDFGINCKVKILIDNDGLIKDKVMLESTGDIEKDNKILEIIAGWRFNASNRLNTEAIVELKYLFK
ncbi:MAG TPA: hypothetical protein PLO89_03340 [Spirochaetota bacterium]|nr:hypothetical protein [Spirochaetota bacterium]